MAKRRVMLTFNEEQAREPIIYNLGQQFNLVTNIRRASLTEDRGWIVLEIEGDEADIEQGIGWVTSKGVRVDPADGEITEA
ncbi:MAG TPA: FeS-binding protein [Dehalococcoidia bacterium]|jgi:ABC-type methionine transport system ATPase subunit|nr:FeS-binding protein [Dehalococcoidia bacterium]